MARIPPVRVRDEAPSSLLGRLQHPSRPHGSLPRALDHFRGGLGRLREGTRETMIDLSTPLSLASSFRFPLQSPESRREIAWGAVSLHQRVATLTRTTPPGSRRRACRPWCRGTSCS